VKHAIQCPSGLIGVVRSMKVREQTILTDRNLARSGGQLDALINACWVETLDHGPYDGQSFDLSKALDCDRFYALLRIRVATHGPHYGFTVPCQTCRARIEWELDLTDLPVRQLSEESAATFRAGNRFETTLPDCGKKVWFRLLVGKDSSKLPLLRKQSPDRIFSASLDYRVLEVEGVAPKEKHAFIEELSMRDASHLVAEFERVDGGVETTIQIECAECYAVQDIDLPFGPSFLMPSTTRKRPTSTISSPA
jgi:hypothetical protein